MNLTNDHLSKQSETIQLANIGRGATYTEIQDKVR